MKEDRDNRIASFNPLNAAEPVLRDWPAHGCGIRRSGIGITEPALKGFPVPGAPERRLGEVGSLEHTHPRRLSIPAGRIDHHVPMIAHPDDIGGAEKPAMTALPNTLLKRRRGNDLGGIRLDECLSPI